MEITLYKITDDANVVTKATTVANTIGTYTGTPIPPSSVLHPQIYITIPTQNGAYCGANYAYIREYNRYYFVNNPTWVNNDVWSVQMDVDKLTSNDSGLRALNAFVVRSESDGDDTLIDNSMPMSVKTETTFLNGDPLVSSNNWTTQATVLSPSRTVNCVVIGLNIGAYRETNTPANTWVVPNKPVLYVCTSFSNYSKIINTIKRMGADFMTGLTGLNNFTEVVGETYVLPYEPAHSSYKVTNIGFWETQNIVLSSWDGIKSLDVSGWNIYTLDEDSIIQYSWYCDFTLPFTELYKNVNPYTNYAIEKLPLGLVDIDGGIIAHYARGLNTNQLRLWLTSYSDSYTGQCLMYWGIGRFGVNTMPACPFYLGETNIKTDFLTVNVNNSNQTFLQTVNRLAQFGSDMGTAMQTQSIAGGFLSGIKSAASLIPDNPVSHSTVSGSPKSTQYTPNFKLIITHKTQLDIPVAYEGRPCYKVLNLGSVSGFTQIGDIHLDSLELFEEEKTDLLRILKEGVRF